MYFGRSDLDVDTLVAFLVGLDLGTGGRLLDGFREYLVLRLGEESSLSWTGLALAAAMPRAAPRPRTPDEERQAVDGLFDLLDEFLAEFPEDRCRRRLIHEYFLWKERLSLVNLDLERFRSSPPPDVISVDEAVALLGISRSALFDLVAAGELHLFRVETVLLVARSNLTELSDHQADGATGDAPVDA